MAFRYVAPHAGAWIETAWYTRPSNAPTVAPHAGAWIETPGAPNVRRPRLSPPTRGRGLKRHEGVLEGVRVGRPPRGGVD